MKKLLNLLLCGILLLTITGCGNKEENNTNNTQDTIIVDENKEDDVVNEGTTNDEGVDNPKEDTNEKETEEKTKEQTSNITEATTDSKEQEPEKTCTPKKFKEKYTYFYATKEECNKESQSTAFFDIVDNVDDRVFTVNCEEIVDDCGTTWYGVSYNIYDPDNSTSSDGVVVVHY